jgi:hypothetical protein
MSAEHKGLPVAGYRPQSDDAVALVNQNKSMEERLLRVMDAMQGDPVFDQRWLAIARTQIEQGFMALNRAVFRPGRISLPEDDGGARQ